MPVRFDKERLLKLKCPCCGSKDKNGASIGARESLEHPEAGVLGQIYTCNQCGHAWLHFRSALALCDFITKNEARTLEFYDKQVLMQHEQNHENEKFKTNT